ncbi:alpha/beta hydrolase [Nocardia harenae]|uniref:alpha/beta hydrolase n=1 Tax=Nocardia harenae TaxID=358707 RepID=UPI0008349DA8|nr:alpha/beta fold hydrolase [Nocardia harenae]
MTTTLPVGATAHTFDSAGTRCAAWHFAATSDELARPAGRPVAVLAHGFGGTKDSGLAPFATALAGAGIDALAFDFRGFGASAGEPRQRLRMRDQIADYRAAVSAAARLPGVDPERVVLWGVSMSGGHVLALAAEYSATRDATGGSRAGGTRGVAARLRGAGQAAAEPREAGGVATGPQVADTAAVGPRGQAVAAAQPRVAAVVSLTPLVDGPAAVRHAVRHGGPLASLRGAAGGVRAGIARLRGEPGLIPLVGAPGSGAALSLDGYERSYRALSGPTWQNGIDPAVLLTLPGYRPARRAADITVPVLMQIADFDRAAPPHAAAKAAFAARAEVRHYPCDHFDVWPGGDFHPAAVEHQLHFLRRHLG